MQYALYALNAPSAMVSSFTINGDDVNVEVAMFEMLTSPNFMMLRELPRTC